MSPPRFEDLYPRLKNFQFPQPLFLGGREEHLKSHFIEEWIKSFHKNRPEGRFHRLPGRGFRSEMLHPFLEDLFAEKSPRLFLIEDSDRVAAKGRADLVKFLGRLDFRQDGAILLSTQMQPEKDFQTLPGRGLEVITVWPLFDSKVARWIQTLFELRAKKCRIEVCQRIAELGQFDTAIILGFINKLAVVAESATEIPAESVEILSQGSPQMQFFEFLSFVGEKRANEAIGSAQLLLSQGESPHRLVAGLGRQFLDVALLQALSRDFPRELAPFILLAREFFILKNKGDFNANARKKGISEEIHRLREPLDSPPLDGLKGFPPPKLLELLASGQIYTPAEIENGLLLLRDGDIALKQKPIDESVLLFHLLATLFHHSPPKSAKTPK